MNSAISKACSQASDKEKGKIEFTQAIPFAPESIVDSKRTEKNNDDSITVTCRYTPSTCDSKNNNYVHQSNPNQDKHLETRTKEDVLCWYITLQGFFKKTSVRMWRQNMVRVSIR